MKGAYSQKTNSVPSRAAGTEARVEQLGTLEMEGAKKTGTSAAAIGLAIGMGAASSVLLPQQTNSAAASEPLTASSYGEIAFAQLPGSETASNFQTTPLNKENSALLEMFEEKSGSAFNPADKTESVAIASEVATDVSELDYSPEATEPEPAVQPGAAIEEDLNRPSILLGSEVENNLSPSLLPNGRMQWQIEETVGSVNGTRAIPEVGLMPVALPETQDLNVPSPIRGQGWQEESEITIPNIVGLGRIPDGDVNEITAATNITVAVPSATEGLEMAAEETATEPATEISTEEVEIEFELVADAEEVNEDSASAPAAALTPDLTDAVVIEPVESEKRSPVTSKLYKVQSGDTLGTIAEKSGISVDRIAEKNKIDDPNFIEIDRALKIPLVREKESARGIAAEVSGSMVSRSFLPSQTKTAPKSKVVFRNAWSNASAANNKTNGDGSGTDVAVVGMLPIDEASLGQNYPSSESQLTSTGLSNWQEVNYNPDGDSSYRSNYQIGFSNQYQEQYQEPIQGTDVKLPIELPQERSLPVTILDTEQPPMDYYVEGSEAYGLGGAAVTIASVGTSDRSKLEESENNPYVRGLMADIARLRKKYQSVPANTVEDYEAEATETVEEVELSVETQESEEATNLEVAPIVLEPETNQGLEEPTNLEVAPIVLEPEINQGQEKPLWSEETSYQSNYSVPVNVDSPEEFAFQAPIELEAYQAPDLASLPEELSLELPQELLQEIAVRFPEGDASRFSEGDASRTPIELEAYPGPELEAYPEEELAEEVVEQELPEEVAVRFPEEDASRFSEGDASRTPIELEAYPGPELEAYPEEELAEEELAEEVVEQELPEEVAVRFPEEDASRFSEGDASRTPALEAYPEPELEAYPEERAEEELAEIAARFPEGDVSRFPEGDASRTPIELQPYKAPELPLPLPGQQPLPGQLPLPEQDLVAKRFFGPEAYQPVFQPPVGQEVSPQLPPLQEPDNYLPKSAPIFNGYIWPAEGTLTSGYGWRWGRMHNGIDIAAPIGTPIVAAAPGVVTFAGWNAGGYGNLVEIEHPDGSLTRYAHNNSISVYEGQEVEQGQQVAEMGSTGFSTGPHLHFEIHPAEQGAVNPMAYLPR
ncbi:MAG: peptidoglycan DD-metalloendopeptidase family protein [Oscillatoria sp. SIO1A7]|nr:peptidoglycan DD-metalloendopeptidase family protein [Oscillatoria sp. SIO1A7]